MNEKTTSMIKRFVATLSVVLWAVLCGHAAELPTCLAGQKLPSRSARHPIRVERDVMPGQMVHLNFRTSSEKQSKEEILFSFEFLDVDGDNCQVKYSDVSNLSKLTPPAVSVPRIGEAFEMKRIAPPYAVAVKILLRNSVEDATARIEAFDLDVRSPSMCELLVHPNVWWRYMPWLAVTAFLLVFVVGVRRLLAQESTPKPRIRGVSVVVIVAMFVAYAAWCLGDVFASDHCGVIQGFAAFATLLFLLYSMLDGLGEESLISRHPVMCLSIMSMVVHLIVIVFCNRYLQQQMTSDSWLAQQCLESGRISVKASPKFHYWCNYELVLSALGIVFSPRLYIGQMVNALCCVGVFFPIYDITKSLTNKKAALFALVAFASYPTNYFHATLLTQEYLCAFMTCWAIWFAGRTFAAGMFSRKGALFAVMCGLVLGLSQLIKPVSPIVLIALGVVACGAALGGQRRDVFNNLIMMLVVIFSFFMTSSCLQEVFVCVASPRRIVDRDFDRTTRMLSCGLDLKGRGKNTMTFAKLYPSRSTEENKRLLYKSLVNDYVHYPVLMAEKFDRVYGSEEGLRRWFRVSLKGRKLLLPFICMVENYYFLFRLLCFIGAVGFAASAFSRGVSRMAFKIEMLIPLYLCGFCAMLMLSEAQGRYRVPTHPESFIMLGYSQLVFQFLLDKFAAFKRRMQQGKGPKP